MNAEQKNKALWLIGIGLLLFAMFHWLGNTVEGVHSRSAFAWMIARWGDRLSFGADYSHGWLIPLFSAWLVWRRRRELRAAVGVPSLTGLAVVVAALLLHWIGARVQQPRLSLFALILLLWGIPRYLYGKAFARLLLFPCAYLLFCIPLNFLDAISFPLRMLASATATVLLNGLGFAAQQVGSAISIPTPSGTHWLDVADPCSGLRSLLAMMALISAYANLTQPTLLRQWALFLLSLPIVVFSNVFRITTVAVVARVAGSETATRVYHDYSGYLTFGAAVLLTVAAGSLLEKGSLRLRSRRAGQSPPLQEAEKPCASETMEGRPPCRPPHSLQTPSERNKPYFILIALQLLTCAALYWGVDVTLTDEPGVRMELPAQLGEWSGRRVMYCHTPTCGAKAEFRLDPAQTNAVCPTCGKPLLSMSRIEQEQLTPDTRAIKTEYTHPGGRRILVALVLSGKERSSIHRPQRCLVGQGSRILKSEVRNVPLPGGQSLGVMVLDLMQPVRTADGSMRPVRSYFAYWFVGRDRTTPYHLVRMFWLAWDRLFSTRTHRWAYVLITAVRDDNSPAYRDEIASFVAALHPRILLPPSGTSVQP